MANYHKLTHTHTHTHTHSAKAARKSGTRSSRKAALKDLRVGHSSTAAGGSPVTRAYNAAGNLQFVRAQHTAAGAQTAAPRPAAIQPEARLLTASQVVARQHARAGQGGTRAAGPETAATRAGGAEGQDGVLLSQGRRPAAGPVGYTGPSLVDDVSEVRSESWN